LQAALDYFDGFFARILNQTSSFGAWLDVVIDNIGRGLLWVHLSQYFFIVPCIEWITFSITSSLGANWKQIVADINNAPFIVRNVMKNGFKSFYGYTAITGLHCLPIWIYIMQHCSQSVLSSYFRYFLSVNLLIVLVIGRALSAFVELWIITKNVKQMLNNDSKQNS